MANSGRKNDNGSQFFLTLGATTELENRNTMFGRVVGDTIYNLTKMGEAELAGGEGNERPLYPTKITSTTVLVNPFEEMVRREVKAQPRGNSKVEEKDIKRKAKKKGGKTLLSFGGEEGADDADAPVLKKEKFNTKLVTAGNQAESPKPANGVAKSNGTPSEKPLRRKATKSPSPPPQPRRDSHSQLPLPQDEQPSRSESSSPEPEPVAKVSSLLDRTNAQIAEMKASMKRSIPVPVQDHRKKSALEAMIPETSIRGRKRKGGGNAEPSKESVDILNAFRARLEQAAAEAAASPIASAQQGQGNSGEVNGTSGDSKDDEDAAVCDLHFIIDCQSCKAWDAQDEADADDDDKTWMSHALSFQKDRLGKDLTWKKKNEEELVVIDPREKAMSIKEEERAKKRARMTGAGSRAWDKDRDRGKNIT